MIDPSLRIARRAMFVPAMLFATVSLLAQEAPTWSKAQQRGCDFLLGKQQDGVFSVQMGNRAFPDAGFTALAISALLSKPVAQRSETEQATIDKGLRWVLTQQNEDGSFGRNVPNYTTCAVVLALGGWQHVDEAKDALAKAQRYVLGIQKLEATGTQRADHEYGGIGYGSRGERADLSNLQFSIAALRTTGLAVDHEAFLRAQVFLQRVQNVRAGNDLDGKLQIDAGGGEHGKLAVGDDGGAVYYPGESPAGYIVHPDQSVTPRSYGSMTYALLKTYTLCGVDAKDARVQAAVRWISEHWTVTENPGADPKADAKNRYQGLFYNYMLMAQAFTAVGIDKVEVSAPGNADGKDGKQAGKQESVDWRKALRQQLESMQREDGSWLNEQNGRWYENLDMLCTCYALIALGHC